MKTPSVDFLIPLFLLGIALAIFVVPAIDFYLSLGTEGRFVMATFFAVMLGFPGIIGTIIYFDKNNIL